MKLKSFFANSIEEAIGMARQELGPEAMLVNSKRSSVEAQHLGFYEVVVCSESEDASPAGARDAQSGIAQRSDAARSPHASDRLAQDVWEIKQQMEKLALTLGRSRRGASSVAFDPELSRAFTALTDAELDTELSYDVVGGMGSPISDAALRRVLAGLVHIDGTLGIPGAPARVAALVGPPGAGKTSALVKLAVQSGLAAGASVQVLSADTYRIGAGEELRSYAAILGIGCQVLETPAALGRALTELQGKTSARNELTLIDTPGLCRSEWDGAEELAAILATHPIGVDTHLVLPASMRARDLRRVSEQYCIFQPRKLLFTRLDETETFGPILSRSVRTGKPVSFLSRGQRIPEDLEPAAPELLLDLVLGPLAAQAQQEAAPETTPDSHADAVEQAPARNASKFGVAAAGKHAA